MLPIRERSFALSSAALQATLMKILRFLASTDGKQMCPNFSMVRYLLFIIISTTLEGNNESMAQCPFTSAATIGKDVYSGLCKFSLGLVNIVL